MDTCPTTSACCTPSRWARRRSTTSMATSSSSTARRSRSTTRRSRISSSERRKQAPGWCRRWWSGRRCWDRSPSNRAPAFLELRYLPAPQVEQWTKARLAPEESAIQRRAGEAAHRQSHEDPEGAARRRRWRAARQRCAAAVQRARLLDPSRDAADGRRRHEQLRNREVGHRQCRSVHFKAQDAFGTIAVGQRADLILVDANLCRTWATWRSDRASWCVDAGCQRRRSTPGSQRSQPPDEAFHGCLPPCQARHPDTRRARVDFTIRGRRGGAAEPRRGPIRYPPARALCAAR